MIRAAPHIAAMAPYQLAQMEPPPGHPLTSLAQNESLRPPSPRAIAAGADALSRSALYPDPDWTALRTALSACHGIPAEAILCGTGSLDLIGCLTRIFAGPDRAVLAPAHAYPFFRTAAGMAGARFDTAAEDTRTASVDALLAAVRPDTALVCLANPGNPTGTRLSLAEVTRLRAGLPGDVLLILDEAYGEFAEPGAGAAWPLVEAGNTVVLRTFSKAYGLAGARVGWGLFPPAIAAEMRKVLNPNNVAAASQAMAVAALEDQAYMRETCALTAHVRDVARDRLRAAGFEVAQSFTNFLLIDLGTAQAAAAADAALRAHGVFLRGQSGAGLPGCLRLTIAPEAETRLAIDLLETWKREAEK